jgi:hypothetical protein
VFLRPLRFVAALAAVLLPLGALTLLSGAGSASAATTNGLVNGTFDSSTTGWAVTPSNRGKLVLTSSGHTGNGALLKKSTSSAVAVRTASPIAMSGVPGDQYDAAGWVRGNRTGEKLTIAVREYSGTTLVRAATKTVSLTAGTWTSVGAGLVRLQAGTTFEVRFTVEQGYSSDQLTLDDVTLTWTPQTTTTTTTTAPAPCYNARGVPACGPLMGSAYGSNSDPAPFETTINHKLGIHRTYWTATGVDSAVKTASNDLTNGRIPWISFKLPYAWDQMAAGAGDAWAKDLATKLAALPGPVWIAFHHEPEGDGDITQWTAMQAHLAPLVRATAPNVAYTIILTGWNELYSGNTAYSLDNIWPKNTTIDIAGFDVYNSLGVVKNGVMNTKGTDLPTAYFKPLSTWAAAHGIAWGLAETGYTDYANTLYPHWIQDTFAAMKTYNGIAFTYFNTTLNSSASWSLDNTSKVADYAAAQAVSPMWTK